MKRPSPHTFPRPKTHDIVGYTYKAENLCPTCTIKTLEADPAFDGWQLGEGVQMTVEDNLHEIAMAFGYDRYDEMSYDSGEFPKVLFRDHNAGSCGRCHDEL